MQKMSNVQELVNSGFGAASTTVDVIAGVNFSNKTAIVMGGSTQTAGIIPHVIDSEAADRLSILSERPLRFKLQPGSLEDGNFGR